MGTAAEKYSKFTSHQGVRSIEPFHNFWFQTGRRILKQFHKLHFFFQGLPNIPLSVTVLAITETIKREFEVF